MNPCPISRAIVRGAWLAALLLLAGCATTRIASTWRDPADSGQPLHRIAIFVAARDDAIGRFAENEAARSLGPGVVAIAGHTLTTEARPDIDKLRERLAREGFDGAIVARVVSVDKSVIYHPPQVQWEPYYSPFWSPYYRSFYWYYPYAFTYTTPAYVTEQTRVLVETFAYRLPQGKPVWSAVSETVDPDSTLDLVTELIRVLGTRLRAEGLLPAR